MSPVERRSEFVIARLGFNPLRELACQGFREDGSRCNIYIPERNRQLAMYKFGHCAHLFSDSEELRDILSAIAHDHHCDQHVGQTSLVEEWISKWKAQEEIDRTIHDVVQKHISDHGTIDRNWQAAFENSIYRVLRTELTPPEKLLIVEDMVKADQGRSHGAADAVDAQSNNGSARSDESGADTGDWVLSPLSASQREHHPLISGPSLPRLTEVPQSLSNQKDAVVDRPTPRQSALSTVANSLINIFTQPFAMPRRVPSPHINFPSVERPTMETVEEAHPAVVAIPPEPNRVLRPSLTLQTNFSQEQSSVVKRDPPLRPILTPPTATSAKSFSAGISPLTKLARATLASPFLATQSSAERTDCDICYRTFRPNNPNDAWKCPQCEARLHIPCFQTWSQINFRQRRRTPCPYCRFEMSHPSTVL